MNNIRGSIFMVLSMGGFALEDMFLKSATEFIPVGEALIIFGLGGAIIFSLLAKFSGQSILHPALKTPALVLRSACEVGGRLFYTLAIALTPLSTASAILQATPLVVTVGAVLFFHETVGWRRWLATGIGFLGVLIILRPGLEGFQYASLFAVLGTIGFAGRDLATRASPPSMSNFQLGIYGFVMLVIAGIILLSVTGGAVWPDDKTSYNLAAATGIGVFAYFCLTAAMRLGEISVVAPFRYTRLIFAMALGIFIFHEQPDFLTLLGSSIIVSCGLYTIFQSNKQANI